MPGVCTSRMMELSPSRTPVLKKSSADGYVATSFQLRGASVSREHILRVIGQTKWVIAGPDAAAAKLGLKRSTLYFRMKKLGITRRPAEWLVQ